MYFSALKVALVVGTVLLLINQYDAIFSTAEIRWLPAILTYCVPFVVFLLGQRNARLKSENKSESKQDNEQSIDD
jgi:hypothetical protein